MAKMDRRGAFGMSMPWSLRDRILVDLVSRRAGKGIKWSNLGEGNSGVEKGFLHLVFLLSGFGIVFFSPTIMRTSNSDYGVAKVKVAKANRSPSLS